MDAISEGFYGELAKLGFDIPAPMKSGGYIAGTLLAGLAVHDMIRGSSLKVDLAPAVIKGLEEGTQVISKEWVEKLLKDQPLERAVKVVTTMEDVEEMLADPKFGLLKRYLIRGFAKSIIEKGINAAVIKGKDRDYLIVPEKANARVIEHEVGHLRDFASGAYKEPGIIASIVSAYWKPSFEKHVLERERRAWKYAQPTPLAEKAVETYESAFHRNRAKSMASSGAGMLFKAMSALSKGVPSAGGSH
jgi:hypothetical protein